ncbi:MAG: molybdenum cofactor biosynthesis protein [Elusimicrobia bacterium CG_4_9_14_3_um_filter_62_55]|nr:MAG: molybdenum cofactor biosynthesis protein [Elusimicrobia bacterium CG22_combo_CG10-13_8_21_14_all_63_91]PJA11868.1 MAG: molybdenum cofactor biosynthesis protein [Elusimicrobia bacterium CG_4_10_14_0_2_um_filter_63_34]PJB23215.1 MAG: molybdenum cofactor biosynthesis protein [Elusimicrobia bacterium CG_4_9_14_3_um_filter_62_55]
MRVFVLTVSDRCSRGEAEDRGGPAVREAVQRAGWTVAGFETLPDDRFPLAERLRALCSSAQAPQLILTTGGTGLGPRDVTPEATRDVLEKELPGFSERMRREGEAHTPLAALSRAVSGSSGKTLIVNLPGSPKGAVESFQAVRALIEHASRILNGGNHG